MKLVYIASPYTGQEIIGVKRQIDIASKLIDCGFAVIWPLSSHFIHLYHEKKYDVWLKQDLELLSRCDMVYRVLLPSRGADIEERHAKSIGIPVYYDIDKLIEENKCTANDAENN